MAKWKKTIDVSYFYHSGIAIAEKGALMQKEIKRAIPDYEDVEKWGCEIEDIYEAFGMVDAADPEQGIKEFDYTMSEFYDFCDYYKVWVKTK